MGQIFMTSFKNGPMKLVPDQTQSFTWLKFFNIMFTLNLVIVDLLYYSIVLKIPSGHFISPFWHLKSQKIAVRPQYLSKYSHDLKTGLARYPDC